MLTEIERSCVHVALNRALAIPENPASDTDVRKAGLALAFARYGGLPELAEILCAAEAIEDFTDGMPATFDLGNVHAATGFNRPMSEVLMVLIGAHQRSALTWSTGDGELISLPKDFLND
ncbi:MAG: hypothetical protein AAFO80_16390 [Pseudomonadota bacterium]